MIAMTKLREVRKQKGLSLRALASITGTNAQTICRYENGQREPKITMVNRLAAGLGVSVMDIIDNDTISDKKKIS